MSLRVSGKDPSDRQLTRRLVVQLSTSTSTEQQKGENSVKGEDSVFGTAGQAQSAERVALFWLRLKPSSRRNDYINETAP